MRIAMMVRGFIPAPRPIDVAYTPLDVALAIAEGLAKKGHSVDLYGPSGSSAKVATKTRGLRPLVKSRTDMEALTQNTDLIAHYMPGLWDHYLALEMFKRASKGHYDLLHFHHPESVISLASLFPKVPVAYTMHDVLHDWHPDIFKLFTTPNQHCISISKNQREDAPDLPYAATVYNGIDPESWPFSPAHDNYLLFAGRIAPEKGVREAVEIARQSGERLIIIGPILRPEHQAYFDEQVKPYLNHKITYLGYKSHEEAAAYFKRAKALLLPLQWEEPFGMTMIESMACGTPVIALRRGSVPEVMINGITGFVVNSVDQMIDALKKLPTIRRQDCRDHVVANFSIDKMAAGYEATFKKILKEVRFKKAERLRKAISNNLYNTVHARQQTLLRFPGRAGSLPDLPS